MTFPFVNPVLTHSDSHPINLAANAEPVGVRLRRARISKGMTIGRLAEETRISVAQLEDIEKGRYEQLPAEVYTRGFVRSYAQAVGVDSEHALACYASERRAQRYGQGSTDDWDVATSRKGLRFGLVVACSAVLLGLTLVILMLGRPQGADVASTNARGAGSATGVPVTLH